MEKVSNNSNVELERHLLGDLLNENDDEGFHSWKFDDSKFYPGSGDHHELILNDIGNKNYTSNYALNNNERFPSLSSTIGMSPSKKTWDTSRIKFPSASSNVDTSSFFFLDTNSPTKAIQTSYSPTVKQTQSMNSSPLQNGQNFTTVKKASNKQKAQRSKDLLLAESPSPSVIGYKPVKQSNRKDVIARDTDYAKNLPRSKKDITKQQKSNSELFINVKGSQSFKSKLSPKTRSSSNENVASTSSGKFTALKQLTDNPNPTEALSSLGSKVEGRTEDECSSVFSGSSNDFDNETTSSRSSRRRQRLANKNLTKSSNFFDVLIKFIFANYYISSWFSQRVKGKKRNKSSDRWAVFWSVLVAVCNYVYKIVFWLFKIVLNFAYQLYLTIGILIRSLIRRFIRREEE